MVGHHWQSSRDSRLPTPGRDFPFTTPFAIRDTGEKRREKPEKREEKSTLHSSLIWADVKPERSEFISGLIAVQINDTLKELFSFGQRIITCVFLVSPAGLLEIKRRRIFFTSNVKI